MFVCLLLYEADIFWNIREERTPWENDFTGCGKPVGHFLHWLLMWEGQVLGWCSWVLWEIRLSKLRGVSQHAAFPMASASAHLVPVPLHYRGKIPLCCFLFRLKTFSHMNSIFQSLNIRPQTLSIHCTLLGRFYLNHSTLQTPLNSQGEWWI